MTLGVLLTRRTHLKILSPVIQAGQRRGHRVLLIADPRPAKKGDRLDLKEVARLFPALTIGGPGHYGTLDALVGIEAALPDLKSLRLIGVDHFYDAWLHPPRFSRNFTMCYHSSWHAEQHWKLYVGGEVRADEAPVVGWLPADQVGVQTHYLNRGIQWQRDAAVFFALKLDVPEPWRRSGHGQRFYRDVFEAAKAKAHAEGLRFVVKSRAKNRDPWWLWWGADEYVLDECMVPYTSLALLARARWATHFESGAGLEAALLGCYSIAVQVPQPHIIDLPGGRLQYGGVAMHDWPGVCEYGWNRPVDRHFWPPAVDPEQRAKYLEHFVGCTDGRAGERVVEIAERGQ